MDLSPEVIRDAVTRALAEDIGQGDLTTLAVIPADARAAALVVTREPGVVAGLPVLEAVFTAVEPTLVVERCVADGEAVAAGIAVGVGVTLATVTLAVAVAVAVDIAGGATPKKAGSGFSSGGVSDDVDVAVPVAVAVAVPDAVVAPAPAPADVGVPNLESGFCSPLARAV